MRMARIKAAPGGPAADGSSVFHCISRTVGGQRLLTDLCRERFVDLLLPLADFCGLQILTYCILSNHFHLLVRVPPASEVPDAELLRRAVSLYGPDGLLPRLIQQDLEGSGALQPALRQSLLRRMGDISPFMQELKQGFTHWYNRRHERFGTLWAERFRSVLVEDTPGVLRIVAAYIDLNPVRAGMVSDPKDYRFSGYHRALIGNKGLQQGLMRCLGMADWEAAAEEYRSGLLTQARGPGEAPPDREALRARLEAGGKLGLGEILHLRIRHLTCGVALGSKDFTESVFVRYRERFGAKRRSGARPIRHAPALKDLSCLRDLRVRALG